MEILRGISVAPGVAIGEAVILEDSGEVIAGVGIVIDHEDRLHLISHQWPPDEVRSSLPPLKVGVF